MYFVSIINEHALKNALVLWVTSSTPMMSDLNYNKVIQTHLLIIFMSSGTPGHATEPITNNNRL